MTEFNNQYIRINHSGNSTTEGAIVIQGVETGNISANTTRSRRKPDTFNLVKDATDMKSKTIPFVRRKLATWHELPEWQKDNEHILGGYVIETNSFKESLLSLFYLHNESVNIYSHLFPALSFFLILLFNKYAIPKFETTSWRDYAFINLFFIGAFTCLICSGMYHCLKSHSLGVAVIGNSLDYLGIVTLISTSITSLTYYGFYEEPRFFYAFSAVTLLLGTSCAVVSVGNRFRSTEWRPYRAAVFTAFGFSSVIPIIAGILLFGIKETWNRIQMKWILLEGFFYTFGAFLYGSRFPERLAPGYFDIWGHSHQIFHVLVVIAACCHFKGLLSSYIVVHSNHKMATAYV